MNEPALITSRDNPLLVKLRKLAQDPAGYRKLGLLWLEGDHLARALQSRGGRAQQALVSESAWAREPSLRDLAGWADKVSLLPDALFKSLSTLESPAAIGFVVAAPASPAIQPGAPSVVLDRLQDAGNVGSILRSAAALGFEQVVALRGTAALWSPKVLRAGMGAHFGLRLVEGADEDALAALQLPLVATSSHTEAVLHQAELPWPCAWVMGHEGRGVAPDLMARCALAVRIPQPGGEESLNVAAAAAVCLYESARRRLQ
ncbi:RNA methyltransferase [Aquincola sp. J276]|uniref:TrmH family RNA methyltransferase n=1 Tax=Aquincola sp. J276 TaxID=2898432 RepID=UPI0021516ECA|nr:RNA methyltransferase [Aquincola sp. J276]MCR5864742.1 RNA methyltransferase [Aquincola sp. J276]